MSSYDQNLLDEAPKATRAQLQEGYNVDLLEQPQPPRRAPSARAPSSQPPPTAVPLVPVIPENDSGEKFGSRSYTPAKPKPRTSFWRSRNGIIVIVLVILVVVGAVVGGAVGGTVKKSNNNKNVGVTGPHPGGSSSPSVTRSSVSPVETQVINGPSTATAVQTGQNTGGRVIGR